MGRAGWGVGNKSASVTRTADNTAVSPVLGDPVGVYDACEVQYWRKDQAAMRGAHRAQEESHGERRPSEGTVLSGCHCEVEPERSSS